MDLDEELRRRFEALRGAPLTSASTRTATANPEDELRRSRKGDEEIGIDKKLRELETMFLGPEGSKIEEDVDEDEVNELLGIIHSEISLESGDMTSSVAVDSDWRNRLDKLKEVKPNYTVKKKSSEVGPPPSVVSLVDFGINVSDKNDDDMVWCCICNDDAWVKCLGCDNDYYCRVCFNEGHPKNDYEFSRHERKIIS